MNWELLFLRLGLVILTFIDFIWGLVFYHLGVTTSYVWGLDFLRLGVSNSDVWGLVVLRLGVTNSYL